jgi:isoleucyl-tRNA synthetase
MDRVRQVASAALSLRKAHRLRVRLPLARLTVAATDASGLGAFTDILADEVNVKDVELSTDVARFGRFELTVNARACGPRLGGDTQKVIRAVKAGQWRSGPDGTVVAAGIELLPGEYSERLVPSGEAGPGLAIGALPGNTGLVVLDTEVTPELAAEGLAKDVVRLVQQARRDAGLNVSDRVAVTLDAPAAVLDAVRMHREFLAGEVLATSVDFAEVPEPTLAGSVTGDAQVRVLVRAGG